MKIIHLYFEFGDLVMTYLSKERFSIRTYNKLKINKIGTRKILRKKSSYPYELELPCNIGTYTIFNVAFLYPFKETKGRITYVSISDE